MSMPKLLISSIAIVGVLVFFQNCQRAQMSTKGTDSSSLAAVGATSTDLNELDNNNPPDNPNDPDDDDDDDLVNNHNDGDDDGNDDNANNDNDNGDNGEDHDCSQDHQGHEQGAREYVCVIAGPGESTRVGLVPNGDLQAQHEGPKLLCMTKNACEVTAAKAFQNAHAEARGFCKNIRNKNVKHVSDSNMEILVDKFIASHPNGPTSTGNNHGNKK